MSKTLFIDCTVIFFLSIVILFCWYLSRRLKHIHRIKTQLEPLFQQFSEHIDQISDRVEQLAVVTKEGRKELEVKIPQALSLKDDFEILLEHSNKIAKRLDKIIEKAQLVETNLHKAIQKYTLHVPPNTQFPTPEKEEYYENEDKYYEENEKQGPVIKNYGIGGRFLSALKGIR
ncbi:MAG: hypothetical protein ACTSXG_02925 [Alphaproteobacteria bacterium]